MQNSCKLTKKTTLRDAFFFVAQHISSNILFKNLLEIFENFLNFVYIVVHVIKEKIKNLESSSTHFENGGTVLRHNSNEPSTTVCDEGETYKYKGIDK